jgi:hypothetical protein
MLAANQKPSAVFVSPYYPTGSPLKTVAACCLHPICNQSVISRTNGDAELTPHLVWPDNCRLGLPVVRFSLDLFINKHFYQLMSGLESIDVIVIIP